MIKKTDVRVDVKPTETGVDVIAEVRAVATVALTGQHLKRGEAIAFAKDDVRRAIDSLVYGEFRHAAVIAYNEILRDMHPDYISRERLTSLFAPLINARIQEQ